MIQKDICDIIIENTLKEWGDSMSNQNKKDIWEVPKYSKSEINKAGSDVVHF